MSTADLDPGLAGVGELLGRRRRTTRARALTRGRIAQALVRGMVDRLPVRLQTPDGVVVGGGDGDSPLLLVHDPAAFFRRLEAHPKIGLGEGFMAGEWGVAPGTDLGDALTPFAASLTSLIPKPLQALRGVVDVALPHAQRNTPEGSRANIAAHYDLSNELFTHFLDESMTYSSALFEAGRPWAAQSLTEAQHRKIDAVLDAALVAPGSRVLEIGTGWGELALRAAARGARVVTITLSQEQAALARERVSAAGLDDLVEIRLQDYRSVTGEFDAVVSVEMIEAVGEEYWPAYFATIDRVLAPSGVACIQAILMEHHRFLATRNSFGWIQKHIFPGGLIPSLPAVREVVGHHTALRVTNVHTFGQHYAETLRRWRTRFDEQWPTIATFGFDETFRRMWDFYLAYCEAGFRTGYLEVAHVTLARSPGTATGETP
ncbi:MAG: class I SAM-dependent methyltransferase [Tetrasphaera sp.]|nr:class I SAM-dependent methyltransferase [Tetrasphaera sp.]